MPEALPIRSIAVLGAGTMGRGIAQAAAMAGVTVRLYDVSPDVLREGMTNALAGITRFEQKGKLTRDLAENAREHLFGVPELEKALDRVDLCIEAIPESPGLKRKLYESVEPLLRPEAILASNTSSLSITRLAETLSRPGRFLGLHFFNPVPLMKLLEIVLGSATEAEAVASAQAFATKLGKEAILVKDSPGFASSRLGIAIGLEAIRMLEEGVASAADIDTAMELGYAHPMGPLKLTDLVGLDVRLAIALELEKELGPRFSPPELLKKMVEAGELGKKSGKGFHVWPAGSGSYPVKP